MFGIDKRYGVSVLLALLIIVAVGSIDTDTTIQSAQEHSGWVDTSLRGIISQINRYAYQGRVAVSVMDTNSGKSYSINGEESFNPASVIKIPVMAAVYYLNDQGLLSLDDRMVLRRENKVPEAGRLKYYRVGARFSIRELLYRMVTESDNTATHMLITRVGMETINAYMRELGLRNTVVRDKTLLDKRPGYHNETTANDMLLLLKLLYQKQLVSKSASEEMLAVMKAQKYRWGIPRYLPDSVVVANKTGSLYHVRNDIGIVFDSESPYIIIVLTRDMPSNYYALNFVSEISRIVYEHRPFGDVLSSQYNKDHVADIHI